MDPEDLLDLLPPLPPIEELQVLDQEETSDKITRASFVKLTDEEFEKALKGQVPFVATLNVHEVLEGIEPTSRVKAVKAALPEYEVEAYAQAAALRYTYRLDALTPVASSKNTSFRRYKDLSREERNQVFTYLTARSEIVSDVRGNTRREREASEQPPIDRDNGWRQQAPQIPPRHRDLRRGQPGGA